MTKLKFSVGKYWSAESGATSIEYALLVAGIAVAMIASVATVGDTLSWVFSDVGARLIEARG